MADIYRRGKSMGVEEARVRQALRHIRHAYALVEPLTDLTEDFAGNVIMKEAFQALVDDLKEWSRCQLRITVGKR
jgi:hypothetical protein